MDELPRLDKSYLVVTSIDDIDEEKKHWFSMSGHERLRAVEIQRRMVYGDDQLSSRLSGILEITELASD